MKMKSLAIIVLAQLALVYTDVSHLTKNYLTPSRPDMAGASGNGMRTTMTFEQHELHELPEQIEYVQQELGQKPAEAMNQQMVVQQYAANMQYMPHILQVQAQQDVKPKMFAIEFMTKQMAQQQQQWPQATDGMPQIQHEMLSMQYMPSDIGTVDMHPEQQSRQLYQQQMMNQPDVSEQRMVMPETMRAMDMRAMQQQPMTIGQPQHAEQLTHVLANDGYHYNMVQSEGPLHRLRH